MLLLTALLSVTGASFCLGHYLAPRGRRSERLMAGAVAGAALLTAGLRLLALAQIFQTATLMVAHVTLLLGTLAYGWQHRRSLLAFGRPPGDSIAWLPLLVASLAVSLATLAAGLLPVWQWDALGYHLPFVQLVLQDHSMASLPRGAEYIDTYPHVVELIFAAWRGLLADDTWVDAAQLPFGLVGALATAALARRGGAHVADALGAGALWLLLPAVFLQLPSNYVDVATAAYLLLASYWLMTPPTPRSALLCGLALGLLLGAKPSTPPAAAVLGLALVCRMPHGQRRWAGAAAAVALLTGGEAYVRNLWLHGNPVWPVSVALGPWALPGNDVLDNLLVSGAAAPHLTGSLPGRVLQSWFTLWAPLPVFDMRVGGWGPVFLLILPMAAWGAWRYRPWGLLAPLVAAVATPDPAVARYVLAMPAVALAAAAIGLQSLTRRGRGLALAGATLLAAAGWWDCLPGLTGNEASLFAWARRPAEERAQQLGPEGPTTAWVRERQSLELGETAATDGILGLPYFLWRSDAQNRVLWLGPDLHGEALGDFLGKNRVRLLVAGDATQVGDLARAQPQRFVPLFRCVSDPCGAYRVQDAAPAPTSLRVAMTFDDLPGNPNDLQSISATLQAHRLPPAYGFVNGKQLETQPDNLSALQRWIEAGQYVGNHTYSHANLANLTVDDYLADLRANEPLLASLNTPRAPWRVFRYPYLREGFDLPQRRALRDYLAEHGYRVAQVTADTLDFLWNIAYQRCRAHQDAAGEQQLRQAFLQAAVAELQWSDATARHLFGRPITHIMLAHSRGFTAAVLDDLLRAYEHSGVEFVELAEALADPVFGIDPAIKTDGDNFLEQVVRARHDSDAPLRPEYPRKWVDGVCL